MNNNLDTPKSHSSQLIPKVNNTLNKFRILQIKITNLKLNWKKHPHQKLFRPVINQYIKLTTMINKYLSLKCRTYTFNKNWIKNHQNCNKNLRKCKNYNHSFDHSTKQESKPWNKKFTNYQFKASVKKNHKDQSLSWLT